MLVTIALSKYRRGRGDLSKRSKNLSTEDAIGNANLVRMHRGRNNV